MKRILVADDDPVIRKLLSGMLTPHGYEVRIAVDGVEALEEVRRERPDLIVLDIMMPRMNGYDVCRALKTDIYLKNIPIILLSSIDQGVQARFLTAMGIEYMNKRSKPAEIMHKIEQMLG